MDLPAGALAPATPAAVPARVSLHGRYTSVVPLLPAHAESLFKHLGGEHNSARWKYMLEGGLPDLEACAERTRAWSGTTDPLYFAVLTGPAADPASEPAGAASYMNIVPGHLRLEIGGIILGEKLGRTRAATEAFFLMIQNAFELGYHRVEWKANNLNKPSLSAAERLGFIFEGVFRNHMIIKGRVRHTAWFSITSAEWPRVKRGFEEWLSEANFDKDGKQLRTLKECREGPGA
ncbi:hypothetical protein VUR80DRAFT_8120 [Thermomyces stellatus]